MATPTKMGRPRRGKNTEAATLRLSIRVTHAELELLESASGPLFVASWARDVLLRAAKRAVAS